MDVSTHDVGKCDDVNDDVETEDEKGSVSV